MDTAVKLQEPETELVNPCSECNYDMGPGYIECYTRGVCPECGHTFTPPPASSSPNRQTTRPEPTEHLQLSGSTYGDWYGSIDMDDFPEGYTLDDVDEYFVRYEELEITMSDGESFTLYFSMGWGDSEMGDGLTVEDDYGNRLCSY